ncbi:MAG: NAD-dependent epimerase/dehydratase family protein [Phycisphaerales bacterium]
MLSLTETLEAYRDRAVVVTGGAGFIGSHLSRRLVAAGARVTVLDDLSSGRLENLDSVRGSIRFVQGSITDSTALGESLEGASIVFHEAALASVPRSIEEPERYHLVNATGTLLLLEASRRSTSPPRIVFASSSSVYGADPSLPKREDGPLDPMSPYAQQKLAGEQMMRVWSLSYGIETVCLRYFNIFGPGQRADSAYAAVVAAFADAIREGRAPTIYGDGTASRDFTYIDNVVEANLRAGVAARGGGEAWAGQAMNIACGGRVTVVELARLMADSNESALEPKFTSPRPGDVPHSQADISRARAWIGYEPTVGVAEGLKRTLAWYLNGEPAL